MAYIIGTAGHIDHGKTSLIKALTGEDTDRLKEEKERGISIDLGFAHLDLPDGTRAGVVDVPGHERFIRNMLAGAHGIDLVLFTVAADDGVMPQTEEHFDILQLLGVERAVFVITKVDLVPPARITEVEDEIRLLTEATSLAKSPIVPFSFLTGQGLGELRSRIAQALGGLEQRRPAGYFRLPIDRVFVLQGHGLVVTGTARSGEVRTGDRVRCLPGDQMFRVRSLQVHNQPVEAAAWGQRIALNLSAHDKPSLERGHMICDEHLTMTSDRFDASIEVRSSAATIKSHQRVRVHLGTAERLGKLIVLGSRDKVVPGQPAFCQIVLSEPLLALRGDRFIIRDETAQRTLGGGGVIHPWPRRHRKRESGLEEKLKTLQAGSLEKVVEVFLGERDDFAVPLAPLYHLLNLRAEEARRLLHGMDAVKVVGFEGDEAYVTRGKWHAVKDRLLAALREFHDAHPLTPGRDMEELRDKLPGNIPPKLLRAFVDELERERVVVRDGSLLRLPEHTLTFRDDEKLLAAEIKRLLGASPYAPPDLAQIERETGTARAKLTQVLRVLELDRSVVRVAANLYFLRESLDAVRRTFREAFSGGGEITPAMVRDRLGTSRKYTIPLLEYFDREGVTVRIGEGRRLKTSHAQSDRP